MVSLAAVVINAPLQHGGDDLTVVLVNQGGALLLCKGEADALLCACHCLNAEDRVELNV